MKSTISALRIENATQGSVKDSKESIKRLTEILNRNTKKLETLKLPSKRELKKLLNVQTANKSGMGNWKPGMKIPKALNAVSAGVTLFTAPAWLPDFAQKHMGIDVINASEKDVYDAPGTRMEKYQQLLREKNKLNWFERNIQGKGAKYDELLYFTKYGRTKSYTFANDGRGTTPTTPTFLEGDAEWQGELTLAQQQDLKSKTQEKKLDIESFKSSIEKFENVFFTRGEPIKLKSGSGILVALQQDLEYPRPKERGTPYQGKISGDTFWPLPNGTIGQKGQEFGASRDGGRRQHLGQDFAGPNIDAGSPVVAYKTGSVIDAVAAGYNGEVYVDHGNGLKTRYYHVNPSVSIGDVVYGGQQIATLADAGQNTHLHFELYQNNSPVDPATAGLGKTKLDAPLPIEQAKTLFNSKAKENGQGSPDDNPSSPAEILRRQQTATTAQPQTPITNEKSIAEILASDDVRNEKVRQLIDKNDKLSKQLYNFQDFLRSKGQGSGARYRTDAGTFVRGHELGGILKVDKVFNTSGQRVELGSKRASEYFVETIQEQLKSNREEIEQIKAEAKSEYESRIAAAETSAVPRAPEEYPSYNRSDRGAPAGGVNNTIIMQETPKQPPIIVTSGGGQQQSQQMAMPPSVSMSQIASNILLTQLSGS